MPSPKSEPLRYRIDPKAKKLDEIDRLERELRMVRNSMDDDDWHALHNVLIQRRAKLTDGPRKASNGPRIVASTKAVQVYPKHKTPKERAFWAVLAGGIVLWFLLKNF